MIRCQLKHLAARCRQRGYTLEEVRACIVSEDGEQIAVDDTHKAYPREPKPQPLATSGPGGQLKKLLKRIGITAAPNCSCNAHARRMDEMGCDWCAANVPTITEWMRGEAAKRKMPFIATLARLMVKRAIHNARKEASNATQEQQAEGGTV
jgi:hypothetical protein